MSVTGGSSSSSGGGLEREGKHSRDNLKGAGLGRTAASEIARTPCMHSRQLVIDFIHEMQLQRGHRQLEA
jgi:hypothetical protein